MERVGAVASAAIESVRKYLMMINGAKDEERKKERNYNQRFWPNN